MTTAEVGHQLPPRVTYNISMDYQVDETQRLNMLRFLVHQHYKQPIINTSVKDNYSISLERSYRKYTVKPYNKLSNTDKSKYHHESALSNEKLCAYILFLLTLSALSTL